MIKAQISFSCTTPDNLEIQETLGQKGSSWRAGGTLSPQPKGGTEVLSVHLGRVWQQQLGGVRLSATLFLRTGLAVHHETQTVSGRWAEWEAWRIKGDQVLEVRDLSTPGLGKDRTWDIRHTSMLVKNHSSKSFTFTFQPEPQSLNSSCYLQNK